MKKITLLNFVTGLILLLALITQGIWIYNDSEMVMYVTILLLWLYITLINAKSIIKS